MKHKSLYNRIANKRNLFAAIYSIGSTIQEKSLLPIKDIKLLNDISDRNDFLAINNVIKACSSKLYEILKGEDLFTITVYFKIKSSDEEDTKYRPIHSADLITQICLVAIYNILAFDDSGKKRTLSSLSQLIPENFYGNIPSTNVEYIFKKWQNQYSQYNSITVQKAKEYRNNKTYLNEIILDMKNFFPSINPAFLFTYIFDKLKNYYIYNDDDAITLKKALRALLFFQLSNNFSAKERKIYYGNNKMERFTTLYSKGLPQGLPHAYYMADIAMVEIAVEIEEVFKGDSYYYVDDSIIFTNTSSDSFSNKLKTLNYNLNKKDIFNIKISDECNLSEEEEKFFKTLEYEIQVHNENGKSMLFELNNPNVDIYNLNILNRGASGISIAVHSSLNELIDRTTASKIAAFLKAINLEQKRIESLKNGKNDTEGKKYNTYLKRLKSFEKFYKFKAEIMQERSQNETITCDAFLEELKKENFNFIEELDNDILQSKYRLSIKNNRKDEDTLRTISEKIKECENKFCPNISEDNRYFLKDISDYIKVLEDQKDDYQTLKKRIRELPPQLKSSEDKIFEEVKKLINILYDYNGLYQYLKITPPEYGLFLFNNCESWKRRLINTCFSYIFNVEISDNNIYYRKDNRPLRLYQIRLLHWLRQKNFLISEFSTFLLKIKKEYEEGIGLENVDYPLMEVLPIFSHNIKSQKQNDDLIKIHSYVNGMWKNGSKFLHFYTLHNTEHTLELIKKNIDIIETIDYFQIKSLDYYVLFLACYLHDISMAIFPNENDFKGDNKNLEIATDAELKIKKMCRHSTTKTKSTFRCPSESDILEFVLDCYKKVDLFFEAKIRNEHPTESAKFIINSSDLKFIDGNIMDTVAEICRSHGYDADDVYGLKGEASIRNISTKYLMILLRLADLLDMNCNRVSPYILNNDFNLMPDISRFHWMSHLMIDKCHLNAEYTNIEIEKEEDSHLLKKYLSENIFLDIYLLTNHQTTDKFKPCKSTNASFYNNSAEFFKEKTIIKIHANTKEKMCSLNSSTGCPLVCRWMAEKNEYLYSEIRELEEYLNSSKSNLFNTKIYIRLIFNKKGQYPANYISTGSKYLKKKEKKR